MKNLIALIGAFFAAIRVVLSAFCCASLATRHAQGTKRIRKLRIAGAQPSAKRTDVGTIAAEFDTIFMPRHGTAHGATFLALDETGQTGIDTTLTIFHPNKRLIVKEFSP